MSEGSWSIQAANNLTRLGLKITGNVRGKLRATSREHEDLNSSDRYFKRSPNAWRERHRERASERERARERESVLCFEPRKAQRITSGLKTNFTLAQTYSFHKSSYHKSCFFSLFIFRGHSTREPASSRMTYFILRAYTGSCVSHSQRKKKSREAVEKMQMNGLEG